MRKSLKLMRFRARELLTNFQHERAAFERCHGYQPNFRNPKSMNEKIVARKLFDRNPLLVRVQDKIALRSYVAEKMGSKAEDLLIPLLAVVRDPEAIPFDDLPDQYVIKPSHLSGSYFIKRSGKNIKKVALIEMARKWLSKTHGEYRHEWAYRKMPKQIIVQPLLELRPDTPADEYQLYMFDGSLGFIERLHNPHREVKGDGGQATCTFYDTALKKLDFRWGDDPDSTVEPDHPFQAIAFMRQCAEVLSAGLDFVRVDFYVCSDGVRIGEMTIYPGAGRDKIDPVFYDYALGEKWRQQITQRFGWHRIFYRG